MTDKRNNGEAAKNIVLVHGGFVDGSGWRGVYDTLRNKGYNVAIVQNPTISLADDVAVTQRTIAAQDGHGAADLAGRQRVEWMTGGGCALPGVGGSDVAIMPRAGCRACGTNRWFSGPRPGLWPARPRST